MAKTREWKLLKVVAGMALLALVGFWVFQWWKVAHRPLGNDPLEEFPNTKMSQSAREQFLGTDFRIVKDVKAIPPSVLQLFTEKGGSRFLIANPGKDFNASDVIYDESVSQKRLIFAGVSGDKCFIFYEQGGFAHMYILAFFALTSKEPTPLLWRGYCEPVTNFQDLRSRVRNGQCSDPVL